MWISKRNLRSVINKKRFSCEPLFLMIGQLRKQSNFLMLLNSVKMAQKFRKEQGILAVPQGYSRKAEEETKVKVKEFFERDDVSCLCLGKKDYVPVELEDGRKEKVQKRLVVKLEGDLPTFCDRRPCCESWILCICHAMIKVVCTSEIIWDTQCMCMYVSPKCETNA